ncbi:MAG TPA: acyl carrier protein [Thermoanaerobaculia bacterium]|nr:acyl carrier protein [Thermoanaerobaculia bacterium]
MTVAIYEILRARTRHAAPTPDLLLGRGGLDLDSIALVEVLLACEERFGVSIAPEMFEAPPLTIGDLRDRIEALRR